MDGAKTLAATQQSQKISGILTAGDNEDMTDAGIHHRLDGVVNHRFAVDRYQVLVGDLVQGVQPPPGATSQTNSFLPTLLLGYRLAPGLDPLFFDAAGKAAYGARPLKRRPPSDRKDGHSRC